MTNALIKRVNLDIDHERTQRKGHVYTEGKDSHSIQREASEQPNPADTFTWDFQLPEL